MFSLIAPQHIHTIEIEPTTFCNAGCPYCSRHKPGTSDLIEDLALEHLPTHLLEKMKESVMSPALPTGAKLKPEMQVAKPAYEEMTTGGVSTTAPISAVPTATASQATASTPSASQTIADPAAITAAQYAATTIGTEPSMTAAQGTVTQPMAGQTGAITSDATVQGQLAGLQQQVSDAVASGGNLPAWAQGAQKVVEANMAKRGMSQSSMYAEALAQGVMQSAIPIASADAQTYKEMVFQNHS